MGIDAVELGILLTWLVGATVLGVQKLKQWAAKHPKAWTARIPWWAWLALSVAIPFGLTYLVAQQWAQAFINPMLPANYKLSIGPDAVMPTALSAAIGSNGAYAVGKRLGLVGDYKPEGPNWVGPTSAEEPKADLAVSGPVTTEPDKEQSSVSASDVLPETPAPATQPSTVSPAPAELPNAVRLRQIPGSDPPLYVVEYPDQYWTAA